jgi:endonuclease-3 related protein
MEIYEHLLEANGPMDWWPAETQLEVVVGAILAQNTNWQNAKRAVDALRARHRLSLVAIRKLSLSELAETIRSSGYYNQKAQRLKNLVAFLDRYYRGSLVNAGFEQTDTLRARLLEINGIGPETADSILLYAFYKPIFVVDAYTRRIFSRHGYFPESWSYGQIQEYFVERLPVDVSIYRDFHAQIVYVGAEYCRAKPRCQGCPLSPILKAI